MQVQRYPTLEQFAANVAAVLGKIEVVEQPLYDRLLYPTAGAVSFQFFTVPQGAGLSSEAGNAGNAKSYADTNMTQNGQLPAPQAFWVDNIQVYADPGSVNTANTYTTVPPTQFTAGAAATLQAGEHDVNIIINSGLLVFTIGQKPYFRGGPLYTFPPQARKRIDAAVAGNSATSGSISKALLFADGKLRTLDPGFGIATGMNFDVTISYAAVQATPSGFNARLGVWLGGWLFRAAQ